MFNIALVLFRELLEIFVILGVITASTQSVQNSKIYIASGILTGLVLTSTLAFFVNNLTFSFGGFGEEVTDVIIIAITVVLVAITAIWVNGADARLRAQINKASSAAEHSTLDKIILITVIAMTIFREGVEIAIFISAFSSAYEIPPTEYAIGLGLGMFSGIFAGISIYYGLNKFAIKYLFKISFIFLTLIAASLASEAAGIMTSIGMISILNTPIWDSSWIISNLSITGRILKILVGYTSKPNCIQIIAYTFTIVLIYICSKCGRKGKNA
jgi:high-affinity iron transporter